MKLSTPAFPLAHFSCNVEFFAKEWFSYLYLLLFFLPENQNIHIPCHFYISHYIIIANLKF